MLKVAPHTVTHQWDYAKVLADSLMLLADIDDVQSAVCILIVMGDLRKELPLDELIHVRTHEAETQLQNRQ